MSKVPAAQVVTAADASEMPLPPQIQEAVGELVGAAREVLMALSVGLGLGVVHQDTLTPMRLGISGQLAKTLCSTNPCESMLETVRYPSAT
jgi:hypothetical protein